MIFLYNFVPSIRDIKERYDERAICPTWNNPIAHKAYQMAQNSAVLLHAQAHARTAYTHLRVLHSIIFPNSYINPMSSNFLVSMKMSAGFMPRKSFKATCVLHHTREMLD